MEYRISSNNSRGQLFLFSYKKGAIIGRRRLFKILLTGSRALNIMLYFPIKSKNNHVNILTGSWLNMGFFQSIPSLVPWLIFRAWSVLLSLIALQLDRRDKRKRRWREGQGRDDYSAIYGQLVNRPLTKARNLREGLGIDSWRGRFTWK